MLKLEKAYVVDVAEAAADFALGGRGAVIQNLSDTYYAYIHLKDSDGREATPANSFIVAPQQYLDMRDIAVHTLSFLGEGNLSLLVAASVEV